MGAGGLGNHAEDLKAASPEEIKKAFDGLDADKKAKLVAALNAPAA